MPSFLNLKCLLYFPFWIVKTASKCRWIAHLTAEELLILRSLEGTSQFNWCLFLCQVSQIITFMLHYLILQFNMRNIDLLVCSARTVVKASNLKLLLLVQVKALCLLTVPLGVFITRWEGLVIGFRISNSFIDLLFRLTYFKWLASCVGLSPIIVKLVLDAIIYTGKWCLRLDLTNRIVRIVLVLLDSLLVGE